MVLYYGLLALETANNTVASAMTISKRMSASKTRPPIERKPSSANSWIYTEDLRKRLEERFIDQRCIIMPVYFNEKQSLSPRHSENTWMYSKSLHDYFVCSKSSVHNQVFTRDQIAQRKTVKSNLFSPSLFRLTNDQNGRHSNPLIKQGSNTTTPRSSKDNSIFLHNQLSRISSNAKQITTHTKKFSRLRSLFLKSSPSLSGP